jgi:hypothetical protein
MKKLYIPLVGLLIAFCGCTTTEYTKNNGRGYTLSQFEEDFIFPDTLFGCSRGKIHNYEKEDIGLGYSVGYRCIGLDVTFYVYDLGLDSVPGGVRSQPVIDSFLNAVNEIKYASSVGIYDLEYIEDGKEIELGGHSFISTKLEFTQNGRQKVSYLLVAGLKNKIFKTRITIENNADYDGEVIYEELLREIGKEVMEPNKSGGFIYIDTSVMPNSSVAAAWLVYAASLSSWEKELDRNGNIDSYKREVFARESIAKIWKGLKINESRDPDRDLDDLEKIYDAGFMEEYVWIYLRKEGWLKPEDLRLDAFKAWADQNLPDHKPVVNPGVSVG